MNFQLNEDQLAFKALAKNFCEQKLSPYAKEWDEKNILLNYICFFYRKLCIKKE